MLDESFSHILPFIFGLQLLAAECFFAPLCSHCWVAYKPIARQQSHDSSYISLCARLHKHTVSSHINTHPPFFMSACLDTFNGILKCHICQLFHNFMKVYHHWCVWTCSMSDCSWTCSLTVNQGRDVRGGRGGRASPAIMKKGKKTKNRKDKFNCHLHQIVFLL